MAKPSRKVRRRAVTRVQATTKTSSRKGSPALSDEVVRKRAIEILRAAERIAGLKKRGPEARWHAGVRVVTRAAMKKLNAEYLGKSYATDILSFPAPDAFAPLGYLGDLVICLPVLKEQARERGHAAEVELHVLLVHGVLHLLHFDHERSPRASAEMARWEEKLLKATTKGRQAVPRSGLIERAG